MNLFFTKEGDSGTSKIKNKKISKTNLIIDVLGELDELNSLIGVVKNVVKKYKKELHQIQEDLFIIQAQIAWILYPKFKRPELKKEKIKDLEKNIVKIENKIKPQKGFIIPGKEINSAWLHYLRAVTRRVERRIIAFNKKYKIPQNTLSYMNRLSSYLYALAREIVYDKKLKEDNPKYK